jgi:hypothetical protein
MAPYTWLLLLPMLLLRLCSLGVCLGTWLYAICQAALRHKAALRVHWVLL